MQTVDPKLKKERPLGQVPLPGPHWGDEGDSQVGGACGEDVQADHGQGQ